MVSKLGNMVYAPKKITKNGLVCLALAVVTLAVFWQVPNHDFLSYDHIYITGNSQVKAGLTREGVIWAFTSTLSKHWHPLTWLSHMLDCELFGLNAAWHHLSSIFLHIVNTILLFLVLERMTGALTKSAFVAALFALHPLHVETVVWVSDRKDLLSTFFWMLTLAAYTFYSKQPGLKRYGLVLVTFLLGLLSKSMLMTLPIVLLALDFWPFGRFQSQVYGRDVHSKTLRTGDFNLKKSSVLNLVLEKIPLIIFSMASAVIATLLLDGGKSGPISKMLPGGIHVAKALVSYVKYMGKMVWPHDLLIPYPLLKTVPIWQTVGAALLLACISYVAIRTVRRRPYFAVGWLWYLVTLAPVIGLAKIGPIRMADRYTYLPLIGLFILVAWGVPDLLAKWRRPTVVLSVLAGIVLSGLTISSWLQIGYWRNSVTLFQHTLNANPNNAMAHDDLGTALFRQGKINAAIDHYEEALKLSPRNAKYLYNLGLACLMEDKLESAFARFQKALSLTPDFSEAINALGLCYIKSVMIDRAASQFRQALSLDPDYADAHNNLGRCYHLQGKFDQAVGHYRKALEIEPNDTVVSTNLTQALKLKGSLNDTQ